MDSVLFCDYPFVFDARAKTLLLQTDADFQMQIALQEAWQQNLTSIFTGMQTIDTINPYLVLMVRREQIVHDTLNQIAKQKRDDLKKPLKVIFINEDAYDAGGVKKEFFMLLIREILDLKYGMFNYYEESRQIWFNDQSLEEHDMYHLIGALCGLAIYNSIIIELPFPLALYKKLLKEQVNLNDLKSLSPTIANSLEQLLDYNGDDFESIFDLTFEITRQRFDETINVELIPNGSKIKVTKDNRKQYVNAYVDFIFNKSCEQAFDAFSKGFHHVCGSRVLELFHSNELMSMVVGNQIYDFYELEKNTEYKGVFWKDHPTIRYFWSVFHEFDLDTKKKFLCKL
jgi:E3 ubiquitin-protein ligase HERC4